MPEDVRTWLAENKEHTHIKRRVEKLRAVFVDEPHTEFLLHGKGEHKQHGDLEDLVRSIAVELADLPQLDSLLLEKSQLLPHATDHHMTANICNRRRGIASRACAWCVMYAWESSGFERPRMGSQPDNTNNEGVQMHLTHGLRLILPATVL